MKFLLNVLLLSVFYWATFDAYAATVTKISKKKKFVIINEGSSAGVTKGARYCIQKPSGKKITCGKVIKVKKTKSYVKIRSKKRLKKIKKGMTAVATPKKTSKSHTPSSVASGTVAGSRFMAFRFFSLPTAFTPSVANSISYKAHGAGVETFWEQNGTIPILNHAYSVSFGGEVDFVGLGLALGGRYKQYDTQSDLVDYSSVDEKLFIKQAVSMSAIGLYLDYYFLKPVTSSGLRLGAGLDVDLSTFTYIGTQKDDGNETTANEIYNIKSGVTTISLRVPVSYDLNIGSIGLNFGMNLFIPGFATKAAIESSITDPNIQDYTAATDKEKQQQATEDLAASLNHTKGSFGLEILVGGYFAL